MTHWRQFTDRETLGAWSLVGKDGKPKDFTLEISAVKKQLVKSREKPKGENRPFIYFKGAKQPLVCNATNADTISNIAGSEDIEKWIGKRVTLYATQVRSKGGKPVQGIRIRPMAAKGPVDELAEQPVDEEMRAAQNEAMDSEEVDRGEDPDGY